MPDTADYAWLEWLLEHPDEWTESDRSSAEWMLENERRALGHLHERDAQGRRTARELVDRLERALAGYRRTRLDAGGG